MRFVTLLSALLLFSCGTVQPAYAQTIDDQADDIVKLCQKDFIEFINDRPNWLMNEIVGYSEEDQNKVLTYCHVYAKGMLDGVVVAKLVEKDAE